MTGGRKDGRARLTPPAGETPIIVLVRPQMARNIGTTARAMANGGLFHLRIVAPRDGWPQPDAYPSASGADAILDAAQVFGTVAEAVADCHRVMATCPRPRHVVVPVRTARAAASRSALSSLADSCARVPRRRLTLASASSKASARSAAFWLAGRALPRAPLSGTRADAPRRYCPTRLLRARRIRWCSAITSSSSSSASCGSTG